VIEAAWAEANPAKLETPARLRVCGRPKDLGDLFAVGSCTAEPIVYNCARNTHLLETVYEDECCA